MQKSPCHTWIYKKITSITEEELIKLIDYAISERSNRSYMTCDPQEYAIKLRKIANTSSGEEICKYRDIRVGIERYENAVQLNNQYIRLLTEAKLNKDFSILSNKILFERHPLFDDYIFIDIDSPFTYCGYTEALYTNAKDIITFLWKCNTPENLSYIKYNNEYGMSKDLETYIINMFDSYGAGNIIIEFAI